MPDSTSRRTFVQALVMASPAVALTNQAGADDPPVKPPLTEVDARMEVVLARFGKQLDAEARKAVRSEVEAIVRKVEELRKVPLTNADAPGPIFIPYRGPVGS